MKAKVKINTDLKSLLCGVITGAAFFIVSSLVAAMILTKNDLSYQTVRYILSILTVISACIAGYIGKRRCKMKGIAAGLITSAVLVALVFIGLLLINWFSIGEEALLLLPTGLLFGALGGIVSSNMR